MNTRHAWLFAVLAVLAGRSAAAQELTWTNLVQHPEWWPAQCAVNHAFTFQGGQSVASGQTLNVLELKPDGINLGTTDARLNFEAKPQDTDALAAARAAWAQLTPAQRALTYPALLERSELWPYRVSLRLPMELDGNRLVNRGESVVVLGADGSQLMVLSERLNTRFAVDPRQTDLMVQARGFMGTRAGAPDRVATELQGRLVNAATGQPAALATNRTIRYYAFYRGAGWCEPCREFTPALLKSYRALKSKYPDFELIYLSSDRSLGEMEHYARSEGFPWLAVTAERLSQLHVVGQYLAAYIPQLFITDRHGKLVIDSMHLSRSQVMDQLASLLQQPPATQ
jgi:thiol-disulfide isomerase/thioredoxin